MMRIRSFARRCSSRAAPLSHPASSARTAGGAAAAAAAAVAAAYALSDADADSSLIAATFGSGGAAPTGPKDRVFTLEEFRNAPEGRVWVSLNGGVYDVTNFMDAHPGGPYRVMMVSGQDLSAFWAVYHEIHDRPHIRSLLEDYRIGNLSAADAKMIKDESAFDDAYVNDPVRPRAAEMRVVSRAPWNMEPPPRKLVETFFTPNDLFFVRNHNPVPDIDADEWRLEIEANEDAGTKDLVLTLADLKTKFPRHEVVCALQCAGNRQEDFVTPDRPLYVAPHWRAGAIGCAKWVGVKVRDIFRAAGLDVDGMALGNTSHPKVKIVNFIGEDADETGTPYAGVIPIEKVVNPFGDAILAYEMNGETLPRDHGYPVRLLAPGHAGCRNVKWVTKIMLTEAPSELDSGSKLDRHFAPDVTFKGHIREGEDRLRLDQGPVIQTLPVQSVIAEPPDRSTISGQLDYVTVEGVAWSGGGRGICRVEVSVDGGETFEAAELFSGPLGIPRSQEEWVAQRPNGRAKNPDSANCAMRSNPQSGMGNHWAWQQFQQQVPIPADAKAKLAKGEKVEMEIVTNAIDGDFNSQPEKMTSTWNVLGICCNHQARIKVTLDPNKAPSEVVVAPKMPAGGDYVWPVENPGHQYRVPDEVACGPAGFKNTSAA